MPDEMLRRLINSMKILRVNKGEDILLEGEPNSDVFLLLKGRVSVLAGEKLVYTFQRIGDIFGEMSYINQTFCSATIRSETDVQLIVISQKMLKHIGSEDFLLWLCRILSDKLNRLTKQVSQPDPPSQKSNESDSKMPAPIKAVEEKKSVKSKKAEEAASQEMPPPPKAEPTEEKSPPPAAAEELYEEEATNLEDVPIQPEDPSGTG
ncbi:MAG: cyclic nucleotide-binding domain-containing protein [SAR324 cluster bacterium]|nr:cyclic nucleotide-binding domain-containing protein [SAR324 cluster bacterium]